MKSGYWQKVPWGALHWNRILQGCNESCIERDLKPPATRGPSIPTWAQPNPTGEISDTSNKIVGYYDRLRLKHCSPPKKTPFALHGFKEAHLPSLPLFVHHGTACNTSEVAKEGCTNNKSEETARNFTDFLPRRVRKSGSTDYSSEKYGKWLHRLVHSLPTRTCDWPTTTPTTTFSLSNLQEQLLIRMMKDCVFRSGIARDTCILLVSSNHLNNGLAVTGDQIT